jgi:putative nucleotidyltransferase with HDIG domain
LDAVLALALAAIGFWAFRKRFWPRGPHECRRLRNGATLVVLQAIFLRTAVELAGPDYVPPWSWWPADPWLWCPWFLTTGLGVMLLGSRLGLLISASGVLLLYLRTDPGPLPLVGCLVSSLFGIVLLRRSTRRRVLRAGIGAGLILGLVALVDRLIAGAPAPSWAAAALVPVVVGLISSFAVLAFLPVMEWVLGELSDVTLAEYGSHHPLLEQLKEQAPGTWHHSRNVSDLAEKVAGAIGARALLCKTAALYHDVGKLKDPLIFAENIEGASPHDSLDPRVSATRIIEHVSHGLELAHKHRLPKAFREIIAEHHGISLVRFFYARACAQLRDGEDAESLRPAFCYPGPPPSSRESGIIALADVVEAATRSVTLKTVGEARALVRKLIGERVSEGEFAECPLTLAELGQAEEIFVGWATSRHHQRPVYPQSPVASSGSTTEWTKVERTSQAA